MIVRDQFSANFFIASVFTLSAILLGQTGARAADTAIAPVPAPPGVQATQQASPGDERPAGAEPFVVVFVRDGLATTLTTRALTVGALLEERGLHPAPHDYLAPAADTPLRDGSTLELRSAVPLTIESGGTTLRVDSAATTVGDLLAEQHLVLRPSDEVFPAANSRLAALQTVRIVRVDSWTSHSHARIAPVVKQRVDARLLLGKSRTLDAGKAGERELTFQFVKRGDAAPTRVVLASRIVHAPRPRIVVRGIATYESLARVAHRGFASALQFASSALHMLATAYTAGCYGCSGITASGARAGFGIIAVDPRMIPLGTHLFIPGYGPAVAGDTGGAILGSRVDLGFNSNGEAMRWGTRPVTVYILK